MGNAILVVDMPKCCSECKLCDEYDSSGPFCFPADKYVEEVDTMESRAKFCPLITFDDIAELLKKGNKRQ